MFFMIYYSACKRKAFVTVIGLKCNLSERRINPKVKEFVFCSVMIACEVGHAGVHDDIGFIDHGDNFPKTVMTQL